MDKRAKSGCDRKREPPQLGQLSAEETAAAQSRHNLVNFDTVGFIILLYGIFTLFTQCSQT